MVSVEIIRSYGSFRVLGLSTFSVASMVQAMLKPNVACYWVVVSRGNRNSMITMTRAVSFIRKNSTRPVISRRKSSVCGLSAWWVGRRS